MIASTQNNLENLPEHKLNILLTAAAIFSSAQSRRFLSPLPEMHCLDFFKGKPGARLSDSKQLPGLNHWRSISKQRTMKAFAAFLNAYYKENLILRKNFSLNHPSDKFAVLQKIAYLLLLWGTKHTRKSKFFCPSELFQGRSYIMK